MISTISMLILHVVFKYMSKVIRIACVYCMYVFTHFHMNWCMSRVFIYVKFALYIYMYIKV
jgi:hypothetical protein